MKSKKKILIVDDSPTVREAALHALTDAGFDVVTQSQASTLPLTLGTEKPDLVLLDVSMPLMTGDKTLKLLRDRNLIGAAKIVLHSSKSVEELAVLAKESQADGFIQKTSNVADLVDRVRVFFD